MFLVQVRSLDFIRSEDHQSKTEVCVSVPVRLTHANYNVFFAD